MLPFLLFYGSSLAAWEGGWGTDVTLSFGLKGYLKGCVLPSLLFYVYSIYLGGEVLPFFVVTL